MTFQKEQCLLVTGNEWRASVWVRRTLSAGDALNFEFDFPEGDEDFKGEFKLVMGYDADSEDEVDIILLQ